MTVESAVWCCCDASKPSAAAFTKAVSCSWIAVTGSMVSTETMPGAMGADSGLAASEAAGRDSAAAMFRQCSGGGRFDAADTSPLYPALVLPVCTNKSNQARLQMAF